MQLISVPNNLPTSCWPSVLIAVWISLQSQAGAVSRDDTSEPFNKLLLIETSTLWRLIAHQLWWSPLITATHHSQRGVNRSSLRGEQRCERENGCGHDWLARDLVSVLSQSKATGLRNQKENDFQPAKMVDTFSHCHQKSHVFFWSFTMRLHCSFSVKPQILSTNW